VRRTAIDAYVPPAPGRLANEYDPDFGVVAASPSTPSTRLLAEVVKGALHDVRGDGLGARCPRAVRAAAFAWLHDLDGIDDYGTAAFCFDRLGINHARFLARLHAGQIGNLWHIRSGAKPYRMRQTRMRAERKRKREVAA
jgi:hypothetical protein